MYWWIVIIVVIVLILILSFEHFEIENSEQLNNLVNVVNSNEVNTQDVIASRKVEGQELGDGMKREIMKIVYPVNSFFFYDFNIELTEGKPKEITNTPLDYGKWARCNYSSDGVIGIKKADGTKEGGRMGDSKIKVEHIPPHKHQYQWNPGRSAKYNSNNEYSHLPRNALTDADIYDVNGKKVSQVDYHPWGYYLYMYRKIEL